MKKLIASNTTPPRPALADGYSWGNDITPKEIAVGDFVRQLPSGRADGCGGGHSGYCGTVYKAARVNVCVTTKYQIGHSGDPNNPPIDLDLGAHRRTEINFVTRGKTVHMVKEAA